MKAPPPALLAEQTTEAPLDLPTPTENPSSASNTSSAEPNTQVTDNLPVNTTDAPLLPDSSQFDPYRHPVQSPPQPDRLPEEFPGARHPAQSPPQPVVPPSSDPQENCFDADSAERAYSPNTTADSDAFADALDELPDTEDIDSQIRELEGEVLGDQESEVKEPEPVNRVEDKIIEPASITEDLPKPIENESVTPAAEELAKESVEPEQEEPIPPKGSYNIDWDKFDDPNFNPFGTKELPKPKISKPTEETTVSESGDAEPLTEEKPDTEKIADPVPEPQEEPQKVVEPQNLPEPEPETPKVVEVAEPLVEEAPNPPEPEPEPPKVVEVAEPIVEEAPVQEPPQEQEEEEPIPPKASYAIDWDNFDEASFNPFGTGKALSNSPPKGDTSHLPPLKPAVTKKKAAAAKKVTPKKETPVKEKEADQVKEETPVEKVEELPTEPVKESPEKPVQGALPKEPKPEKSSAIDIPVDPKPEEAPEQEEELVPPKASYAIDWDNFDEENFNPFGTNQALSNSPPKGGGLANSPPVKQLAKPAVKKSTPKKTIPVKKSSPKKSPVKEQEKVVKEEPPKEKQTPKKEKTPQKEIPPPASMEEPLQNSSPQEEEEIPVPKASYNIDWDNFDENINPFAPSKRGLSSSPPPGQTQPTQPELEEDIDPFKPRKTLMASSPPTSRRSPVKPVEDVNENVSNSKEDTPETNNNVDSSVETAPKQQPKKVVK